MLKFKAINGSIKLNMELMISYLNTKLDHKQKSIKKSMALILKNIYSNY